jgi:hypothetical protein
LGKPLRRQQAAGSKQKTKSNTWLRLFAFFWSILFYLYFNFVKDEKRGLKELKKLVFGFIVLLEFLDLS